MNRRIGRNELEAIAMLWALADAQTEYAGVDHVDDQVLEYAQRLVSSPAIGVRSCCLNMEISCLETPMHFLSAFRP
ncbi:MAG: DUF2950 domain-containing protein [Candidatus Competibacteraceae bacterium]|nr:DUF2950 domain-containing protein [Candidatus Competibacteraceae bacterium]